MKKITAFLLCLSIVSGMCAPVYALEPLYTKEEWEKILAERNKDTDEQDQNTVSETVNTAGDIDEDGDADVTDLSSLALYLIGDMKFTEKQKKTADVDDDGDVTLADLAKYRQFLSKKIPYLVEPENTSDPGDKPTEPSVEPVTPMYPQPTGRPDIDAVKQMIKTGDVSGYDEERRQKYKDVYDRFTEDGYIIQPLSSADENGIKYAEDREVWVLPDAKYEDMGVLYNMEYKGVHYSVSVHFTEPQYKDSFTTMAEYHELRMGSMERYEEADNKTIIAHLPLRDIDNGTQIVSYSLIDYNDYDHYCRVSTTASDEDYAEFMEMLQLKKNYLNAPLLVIRDENAESDKINSLICEDGRTYSVGIILFNPRPDDTLLKDDWFSYIIDYSENESYIEDKYFLTQLSKMSKYAAEKKLQPVKDTGIKSLNESDLSLNIIYTDETGKSVTPVLLSKTDGKYFMADYNETQILADSGIVTLIRYLTGYGLIDQEFLKAVDSIEIPEEDNVEPVYDSSISFRSADAYLTMRNNLKNLSDEEYETYSFSIEGGSHPDRTELAAYDKLMSSLPLPVLENAKITWIHHQVGTSTDSIEPYDIAAVSLDLGNDEWVRIEYLLSETDPDALAEKLSKNMKYSGAIYFMRIKSGNVEFLSEDYSEESGVKTLYGVYEGTVFRAVLKTKNAKDLELDTFANDMVFGTLENYLSDESSSTHISE